MRTLLLTCLFILVGCSHDRSPASLGTNNVASDSMALGNVKATATKTTDNKNVCFDIALMMKGVEQKDASAANWTVAWIDQNSKYHLLSLNQRDPASIPQGGTKVAPYGYYQEWRNNFKACAPKAVVGDAKGIILTPKELPYKENESLNLVWK